jgi:preprotein translocase subunit SecD
VTLTVLCVLVFAGFPPRLSTIKQKIHLGLDLSGGSLYELEVITDDAVRVDQTINLIRTRIDRLGVVEPTIQKFGPQDRHRILVQLPKFDDTERVKTLLKSTAQLQLKLVAGGPFPDEPSARGSQGGVIRPDLELLPSKNTVPNSGGLYLVKRTSAVTGADLKDAFVSRDDNGNPAVGFSLNADSARRFAQLTEQNIGKQLAIVLDGAIQSAPYIDSRISDSGIIKGGPSGYRLTEARDLALMLRSGALPASVRFEREEKVSATLGADSVRSGVLASAVALGAVVVFMLSYYRLSGVNAMISMLLNVIILLAAIAYFGITVTLPGIAGVTLTIGVGIDSNVLIFERIREELRAGRSAAAAVAAGFNRVFVTLIDTHLAALISAVFLFLFGSGPVKGFAVTMVIGLVSNMFTAVFVSRTLFDWVLARKRSDASISI